MAAGADELGNLTYVRVGAPIDRFGIAGRRAIRNLSVSGQIGKG
jgi:hypothetical protein